MSWIDTVAANIGLAEYLEDRFKWPTLLAFLTQWVVMFAIGNPWWRRVHPAIDRPFCGARRGLRAGVAVLAIAVSPRATLASQSKCRSGVAAVGRRDVSERWWTHWSVSTSPDKGSFDYAADAWGFTYGAAGGIGASATAVERADRLGRQRRRLRDPLP